MLLLLRGKHLPAGLADLVALLVQARDDPATAGRDPLAEFAVVALARGALLRREILRLCAGRQTVTNRQSLETLYPSLNRAVPAQHLWSRLKHALAMGLEFVGVWPANAHVDVAQSFPVDDLALLQGGAKLRLSGFCVPTSDTV